MKRHEDDDDKAQDCSDDDDQWVALQRGFGRIDHDDRIFQGHKKYVANGNEQNKTKTAVDLFD